ncbi:cupin domain-containing protein [Sphaerisporangium corydalis]|uniref:Cupin domain-containing protein n=1 Tax=Sphaerisporangium corydalis TaxID=1441875 RepID=A0ABV9ECE5_9ACTN|nr:cupin domain-containing protein [Sphaerisporangium corydalis]
MPERGMVEERPGGGVFEAPLLICDWAADGGVDGTTQWLGIDMTPHPTRVLKTRAATGRSLVTSGHLGADLLHLPAGEGFLPHTHPGDHLLIVVGGHGTITVDGAITATAPGQVYMVRGAVPHAVGAVTDHVILAVGAPHRLLDSPERQDLTEYSALLTSFGTISCRICGVAATGGEELEGLGCPHSPHRFG